MSDIAGIVAPVFALILMGFVAARTRLLDAGGLRGLNDFTFYAGIPALLFGAVVQAPVLRLLDVAGVYFAGALAMFALAAVLARWWLGAGLAQAAMVGLNTSYGNTVMLALPVISEGFGAEGVAVLLPVITLQSVVLLTLTTVLIEAGAHGAASPWRVLRVTGPSLVRNPVILALVLALVWRALDVPLPAPLQRLLALLGAAAPTLALICLGASLPGLPGRAALREVVLATALKLVVMPALIWALATAARMEPFAAAVLVVTAGVPTGANAFFLARRATTQALAEASAGTVVAGTAVSVLTLSALLAWLR